jgi:hypothetical protein
VVEMPRQGTTGHFDFPTSIKQKKPPSDLGGFFVAFLAARSIGGFDAGWGRQAPCSAAGGEEALVGQEVCQ